MKKLSAVAKKQIVDMIEQIDKTLRMLIEGRDMAKDAPTKAKWNERIDAMLEERFRLMQVRDGKKSLE
jgi:hypothetical protein